MKSLTVRLTLFFAMSALSACGPSLDCEDKSCDATKEYCLISSLNSTKLVTCVAKPTGCNDCGCVTSHAATRTEACSTTGGLQFQDANCVAQDESFVMRCTATK